MLGKKGQNYISCEFQMIIIHIETLESDIRRNGKTNISGNTCRERERERERERIKK